MASKIKTITVVIPREAYSYQVGHMYNGLILEKIEDKTLEFPDSMEIIYMGFTLDGDRVFELINVPVDVEYEKVEEQG